MTHKAIIGGNLGSGPEQKQTWSNSLESLEKHSENHPHGYILQAEDRRKTINSAILLFEAISPVEARQIWMLFNGLSYREMAIKELKTQNKTEKDISSQECAIRKQFARANTGTLAKFRIVLERYLRAKNLEIKDILE